MGEENILEAEYGMNIIEAQLYMSCDKTINKILFYMSKLPIQESFFLLMPNFKDLVDYKRFEDYLDQWFKQTQQMK